MESERPCWTIWYYLYKNWDEVIKMGFVVVVLFLHTHEGIFIAHAAHAVRVCMAFRICMIIGFFEEEGRW